MEIEPIRRISQLVVLFVALVSLGAVCSRDPFFMLQTIFARGSVLPTLILASLGGVIVFSLIFGRAFCSWVCPFGTILDILNGITSKKHKIPEFLEYRSLKYSVLGGFLITAFVYGYTAFCTVCPAGVFFRYVEVATVAPVFPLMLLVAVFVFAIFYHGRAWCRYLCPLGAFLSLVSKFSFTKLKVDNEKCRACLLCQRTCAMDLLVVEDSIWKKKDAVPPAECIRCGDCINVCPAGAIEFDMF